MTATIDRSTVGVDAPPPPNPPVVKAAKPRDPRYLALRNFALSMSVFNIFGYTVLGFEQPWLWPVLALLTGYVAEILVETVHARVEHRSPRFLGAGTRGFVTFLLPAHITSLAVNMLLYANDDVWPILFGVVVAITQKSILQAPFNGRMRHFMNPSNFGITVTLLLFPWVSIAPPYHFTENVAGFFRIAIPMLVITAGTVLNATLTRKVPLIVGWLGGFVIQAVLRWAIWDVALFSALAVMSGVAFVLFTNYMITDPGTTPFPARAQFLFGSSVAMTYGVLMVFNVVYTLFFAVTIVCAVRGASHWVAYLAARRRERLAVRPADAGRGEPLAATGPDKVATA